MRKFELGQIVTTRGVHERMASDQAFKHFVETSLGKYINGDWGDTCNEDKAQNDQSIENDERILAVYNYHGKDDRIWIITEWDRSATTILFPSEY